MTLVDTDILIWALRGHEGAATQLEKISPFSISTITYLELLQGLRNKAEWRELKEALRIWGAQVLPISEGICSRAVHWKEAHLWIKGLKLQDALIAATAVEHDLEFHSANVKDFKVLSELRFKPFRA